MRTIAIANHKGGVGKTTSVACLGVALASMGRKVLLVDLDAQANLTSFFLPEEREDEERETIYNSFKENKPAPLYPIKENLDLIPSSLDMAFIELEIGGRMAREFILRGVLEPIAQNYDYILLDCPPSLGVITTNAFVAATDIYIALTAEALPLKGLRMLDSVIEACHSLNRGAAISGVFFTRYNSRKSLSKAVKEIVEKKYGAVVFSNYIRENVSVAETPLQGGDLFEYAPQSNGAEDYMALAKEIDARKR